MAEVARIEQHHKQIYTDLKRINRDRKGNTAVTKFREKLWSPYTFLDPVR